MSDTTFKTVLPPLRAADNGDGTYSMAVKPNEKSWVETLPMKDRPLTADGIQYNVDDGDAVATVAQSVEKDLYVFTLNTRKQAETVVKLTLGLTIALIQITGAVNGVFRWYVRPGTDGVVGGAEAGWCEIFESASIALPAAYSTTYGSCAGEWNPTTPLTYPFQLKLTLTTDGATNMGAAKVQNTSFVTIEVE